MPGGRGLRHSWVVMDPMYDYEFIGTEIEVIGRQREHPVWAIVDDDNSPYVLVLGNSDGKAAAVTGELPALRQWATEILHCLDAAAKRMPDASG